MNYFAFLGSGDGLYWDTFISSFFLTIYVIFIVPIILSYLLFKNWKKIIDHVYISLLVLVIAISWLLIWVKENPSDDFLAAVLNFALAPFIIIGSYYFSRKLSETTENYKLKLNLLRLNSFIVALILLSGFLNIRN